MIEALPQGEPDPIPPVEPSNLRYLPPDMHAVKVYFQQEGTFTPTIKENDNGNSNER